ncbi:MAG: zf-HC2 domain-containing protein [Bacteroidota bacterium]
MKTNDRKTVETISCEQAIKLVFNYIDDELRGKRRGELEHHLETCRHCFDRVEFEKLLKSRLRQLKVGGNSKNLRSRIDALLGQF